MSLNLNSLDLHNKKIVIVEDDLPSIKYYETLLSNTGSSVRAFTNGKEFIDYINADSEAIDLVIIDFLIPFINGIECTRILRRSMKHVPVLMLSAYYTEQSRNEALIAGCNEYVLKPVYPEKIFYLLEKYLKPEISYHSLI